MRTISRPSVVARLSGVITGAAFALGLLVCTSWTDCAAYTFPEKDRSNPGSLVPPVSLSVEREGSRNVGRLNRLPVSGSRRGISQALKRSRQTVPLKQLDQRSAAERIFFGEIKASPGFGPDSESRTVEQASREVGIYAWSNDLRRQAHLVFDREQRVLADRLTRVPPVIDSITGLAAPSSPSILPGQLQWPELNAYEIWVAELLGL